ncbi:MAG: hypothetical protein RL748_3856 [Pseudomonadota bacterium]|jgi:hypothetical protein
MKSIFNHLLRRSNHEQAENDLIHAFVLDVDQPFDAHRIWQSNFSLADNLLKNLLDRYPAIPGQASVFSAVQIELPSQAMQADLTRTNGALSQNLVTTLEHLHADCFAKKLPQGVMPRYQVKKNPRLARGQVKVSFGHGVYVAEKSETKAWRLEYSANAVDWGLACDMYQQQRVATLGGDLPDWPFGNDYSITVVNDVEKQELAYFAEPAESLRIHFDTKLNCHKVGWQANSAQPAGDGRFFCFRATRLHDAAGAASMIAPHLRGKPSIPQQANAGDAVAKVKANEVPKVWRGREADEPVAPKVQPQGMGEDRTFVAAMARSTRHLSLVGIALQRLSMYREIEIDALQFGFDAHGKLVPPCNSEIKLAFLIDGEDHVRVLTASPGSVPRALAMGQAVPLSNTMNVMLDDLSAAPTYLGWLNLPVPVKQTLREGKHFSFGRAHPCMLRALSGREFLRGAQQCEGDRMGLSRQHFDCVLTEAGLRVDSFVKGDRLLHLDAQLQALGEMDCLDGFKVLAPGHHLLAGPYLLRFEGD